MAEWPLPYVRKPHADAPVAVPPPHQQGNPRRGRNRQPQADAQGRHDPQARRRPVHLVAAGPARAAQGRARRARGDERRRRHRSADAGRAAEGAVGGDRPLGEVRRPVAEDEGPQGRLVLLRPHARGSHHRLRAQRAVQLQAAAGQFLPDPDQVPRRDPPAFRRDARARVPDEGQLLLPRRPGRPGSRIQEHVRHLRPHLHAPGAEVPRGVGRQRRDRRRGVA